MVLGCWLKLQGGARDIKKKLASFCHSGLDRGGSLWGGSGYHPDNHTWGGLQGPGTRAGSRRTPLDRSVPGVRIPGRRGVSG